jgi:hypothetical protein
MTPGNLDALAYEELEFDDISRWLDENVPQIRVPAVIIGALGGPRPRHQRVGSGVFRQLAVMPLALSGIYRRGVPVAVQRPDPIVASAAGRLPNSQSEP